MSFELYTKQIRSLAEWLRLFTHCLVGISMFSSSLTSEENILANDLWISNSAPSCKNLSIVRRIAHYWWLEHWRETARWLLLFCSPRFAVTRLLDKVFNIFIFTKPCAQSKDRIYRKRSKIQNARETKYKTWATKKESERKNIAIDETTRSKTIQCGCQHILKKLPQMPK